MKDRQLQALEQQNALIVQNMGRMHQMIEHNAEQQAIIRQRQGIEINLLRAQIFSAEEERNKKTKTNRT